jgi:hypothetical protein
MNPSRFGIATFGSDLRVQDVVRPDDPVEVEDLG